MDMELSRNHSPRPLSGLMLAAALALSGCGDHSEAGSPKAADDTMPNVVITRIEPFDDHGVSKSLLYGVAQFEPALAHLMINLNCVLIATGEAHSESIHLDGANPKPPDRYRLEPGRTNVRVYWQMSAPVRPGSVATAFRAEGCELSH